jgi:putative FmdB family regulatory protein
VPTYSYQCKEFGEAFDAVQSFSDDPLTVCPNCGGPLRKLFNSVGVVFKGSGFYRTDSRSSKADTTAKPEKKSDTATKVDKATSS